MAQRWKDIKHKKGRGKRVGKTQADPKKKDWLTEVSRWAKIAGRVAELAIHIHGKPKARDWIALGAAALDVAMEIRTEQQKQKTVRPWAYFDDDTTWNSFPISLTSVAFRHVEETAKADIPVSEGEATIYHAKLGTELVGWYTMGGPTETPTRLYYKDAKHEETMKALANVIWQDFKTSTLCYTPKGLTEMLPGADGLIDTAFIDEVYQRAKRFADAGDSRGYLLEGPPGAGKSTCIRRIVERLGMKSLHIELGCLDDLADANEAQPSINTVIRILQPDALIIDDVDRLNEDEQAKLLFLLERARALCKVVFVTVNDRTKLMDAKRDDEDESDSAMLRPGRLDDHIFTPPLEASVVLGIIGADDEELVERMRNWPIAYVLDYAKRKKILGRDVARGELDELGRRATTAR